MQEAAEALRRDLLVRLQMRLACQAQEDEAAFDDKVQGIKVFLRSVSGDQFHSLLSSNVGYMIHTIRLDMLVNA